MSEQEPPTEPPPDESATGGAAAEQQQPEDSPPASRTETPAERSFRRRVGLALASLAMLGAWIAVLQTNASTNESKTTREATRLANQTQTAEVLAKGVQSGLDQIDAEIDLLPTKPPFQDDGSLATQLGVTVDPARSQQRLQQAQNDLRGALGSRSDPAAELTIESNRLSLTQKETVKERVSWNARASQYETVLTVLAVAIFLVGFALVLDRKLRPPVAVPGILLAIYCLGWAVQIYVKPTPHVATASINATAAGEYEIGTDRASDAIAHFDKALDSTPDYLAALQGRALGILLKSNPDLLNSLALTDTSAAVLDPATRDLDAAMDAGGDESTTVLAISSIVAVASTDWGEAATTLEQAIDLNELAAELYLWRAAVAVAQGDPKVAQTWVDQAVDRFGDLDPQRTRVLAAQYLTLLEFVAAEDPTSAKLAQEFQEEGVKALTAAAADRKLDPGRGKDASITSSEASFVNGLTSVSLQVAGVADDDIVTVVGYERPAPGAAWVQPAELFYTGPAVDRGGVSVPTPQKCVPVEYRFDLYVEGVLRDSSTAPGGTATC